MRTKKLNFHPLAGLASNHLQVIISSFLPPGAPPHSKSWLVDLEDGNRLSCEVSTPSHWKENDRTVVMVHGMGGSHSSNYMIRISRKLHHRGDKVVRINLRGCGSGKGLSKLPYNAGTSADVLKVLQSLKKAAPLSEISLIGFSLGGNIVLKLAGELGKEAENLVKVVIAVCAPLDLAQTVRNLQEKRNRLYHFYYLKAICDQGRAWVSQKVNTLYEFDDLITAPLWGYKGASEYYEDCSSIRFLPHIQQSTHLLFAEDDPFISSDSLKGLSVPNNITLWSTKKGGHMGFLGKAPHFYWMDHLLLNWLDGDFNKNLSQT